MGRTHFLMQIAAVSGLIVASASLAILPVIQFPAVNEASRSSPSWNDGRAVSGFQRSGVRPHTRIWQVPLIDAGGQIVARHALESREIASGMNSTVYGELSESGLPPNLARQVIHTWETVVRPRLAALGSLPDPDGDGQTAFVLLPDKLVPEIPGDPLRGFVLANDLLPREVHPASNEADLVYLVVRSYESNDLAALLAHEGTHLLRAESLRQAGGSLVEADWLNEGLAHLVEQEIAGLTPVLEDRVRQFLDSPDVDGWMVEHAAAGKRWRSGADRGAAFLFLHSLSDGQPLALARRLIESRATGLENLKSALGRNEEEIFKTWSEVTARWSPPSKEEPLAMFRRRAIDRAESLYGAPSASISPSTTIR
ncbi:MAG: hypothetical protein KF777_03725 [Planctomycetaceae bacterium]|nr:hypothetical protein [Planctomycetaceae bacterium]